MKAVKGEKGIVEPTFIYLPGVKDGAAIAKKTGSDFFSVPVELGVRDHRTSIASDFACTDFVYSHPALRRR